MKYFVAWHSDRFFWVNLFQEKTHSDVDVVGGEHQQRCKNVELIIHV
jgi:hypothetical protein